MQTPFSARRDSAPTSALQAAAHLYRRLLPASRSPLGIAGRLSVLISIVFLLSAPFQSAPSTALATHTTTAGTPTATPWPYGQGQSGVGATSTPTPFGYSPYQPAQGQTQYPGSPNQTYPGTQNQPYPAGTGQQSVSSGTGQQSVSSGTGQQSVSPSYGGVPIPGSAPAPGGLPGSAIVTGAASPVPGGSDVCYGDELITYSPEAPRIGNELLIAVTSARPHPYGRLAGTEPTQFVRERPGQRGYVWEWTVQPSYPDQHEYTFFVDSTIPCQKIHIRVMQSLSTRTPTPTKTATPYNFNENSNGNSNNNSNDNTTFAFPTTSAFAPVVDPSFYVVPGQDLNACSSFESQSNAQRVLRYDPSDPNNLDFEDGVVDGVACMTWYYPLYPSDRDVTPVPRVTPTRTPTPSVRVPR